MSLFSKGKVFLALGVVMVVAASVGLYFVFRPALKVGSFSVSKSEYKTLVSQAKAEKVEEHHIQSEIIEAYKLQEAAKKTGISYSMEDAKTAAADQYQISTDKLNAWQVLYGQTVVIKNAVNYKKEGGVRGTFFNYPFAANFAFGNESAGPNYGKVASIEADKAYALKTAQTDHQQLLDGKITPDALLAKLVNDSRLNYGNVSNGSLRFAYTNSGKWLTFRDGDDVISKVYLETLKKMKVGVSDIATETVTAGYSMLKGYDKAGTAVAYNFYKIDEVSQADKTFETQFNKAESAAKVVKHV